MDGLIIKPKWGSMILSGQKDWEIRGSNTKHRGKHYLIYSGTNKIFGEINIIDSFPLSEREFSENRLRHRLPEQCSWSELLKIYKKPHKWIIAEPVVYDCPISYVHPRGAVIWVKNIVVNRKEVAGVK